MGAASVTPRTLFRTRREVVPAAIRPVCPLGTTFYAGVTGVPPRGPLDPVTVTTPRPLRVRLVFSRMPTLCWRGTGFALTADAVKREEGNPDTCWDVGEPWGHRAK